MAWWWTRIRLVDADRARSRCTIAEIVGRTLAEIVGRTLAEIG